jgi:hypothetical protein
MNPEHLLNALRAMGATVTLDGDRLRVCGVVLSEALRASIRAAKPELVRLMTCERRPHPWRGPTLDPETVREVVGADPTPAEIEMVQHQVAAAVASLRFEMLEGRVHRQPRLVFGRPLGDWLGLDTVATLLRDYERAIRRTESA